MNYLKSLKWEMIIFSLGCIGFGAWFVFDNPKSVTALLGVVIAVIMFFYAIRHCIEYFRRKGLNSFTGYELVLGVVFLALGFIALYQMDTIIKLLAYLVGIIILVSGLMKLENAFDLKRMGSKWIPMLIIALIFIVLAFVFFIKPPEDGNQGDTLIKFSGIAFMFVGLINLITTLAISGKIKNWTRKTVKTPKVIDVEYEEVDEDK